MSVAERSSALKRAGLMPWMMLLVSIMAFPGGASAAERLHGVILETTPANGQAIIRHDSVDGMPSMTMPFQIVPRSRAAALPVGASLEATVDRSTEPWTLRDVRVAAARPQLPPLRRVPPARIGEVIPEIPGAVDQAGRPFRFADYRGSDVVLAFIYTRCQDARMCPLISAKFHQLQNALGARKAHLVEVTLDPVYDQPRVLAKYARTFGADAARWSLVTGAEDPVLDFSARFGIGAFTPKPGTVVHAENTVLIDRDGRIRNEITETSWSADEIVAEIDNADGAGGNPIARFGLWLSKNAAAACGNATASFSGLTDLAVVIAIFGGLAYLVFRLARGIFAEEKR